MAITWKAKVTLSAQCEECRCESRATETKDNLPVYPFGPLPVPDVPAVIHGPECSVARSVARNIIERVSR